MNEGTGMDDFDGGFDEMMSSAMEYEKLKRAGKRIPKRPEERLGGPRNG